MNLWNNDFFFQTDEINARLGIAKTMGGDNAGAKSAFEAVQGGARKQIADLWLTYLGTKA